VVAFHSFDLCAIHSRKCGVPFFGALFLWAIFGSNWQGAARAFGTNSWDPDVFTGGQVFFAEMLGTGILMYTVFATIDIPHKGGGALGVYPIAMSVMIAHLFLLPIDGCSINPTRSFGPALVAGMAGIAGTFYKQQYMFWFAPLFGAGLAAIVYEYCGMKLKKREGAGDMDVELYMADVARNANGKGQGSHKGEYVREDNDDDDGAVIPVVELSRNSNTLNDRH